MKLTAKKLMAIVCTTILSLGLSLASTTPAHATADTIAVCNLFSSDDAIEVYNYSGGWSISDLLYPGECNFSFPDEGNARVDVDPSGGFADIDSWKKRKNDGSWGPCYNNEDGASNPYSDANGTETEYVTYDRTNCF
jgi:hypothetical protein